MTRVNATRDQQFVNLHIDRVSPDIGPIMIGLRSEGARALAHKLLSEADKADCVADQHGVGGHIVYPARSGARQE